MKRLINVFSLFVTAALFCSCSLTYDNLVLQVMNKSHSGLDLRHKAIAAYVVYKGPQDSVACSRAMFDFIEKLSAEYNEVINLYAVPFAADADYSDTRTIAEMLTKTEADVVFISVPMDGDDASPAGFRVYAYDGMASEDQILATPRFKQDSIFVASTSKQLMSLFGPNWTTGVFRVLLYENQDDWLSAYIDATDGKWTSAIGKWMSILGKTKSIDKMAAAEYNISLGCYLTGQIGLAEKWLDRAMVDCGSARTQDYMKNLGVLIKKEKSK